MNLSQEPVKRNKNLVAKKKDQNNNTTIIQNKKKQWKWKRNRSPLKKLDCTITTEVLIDPDKNFSP